MSKIQLLRALVSERLSVAAEEIFQIVERTLVEYEKDVSHSKWVVDHHHRLLNVEQSHSTDSLQVTASAVRVPSEDHQPSGKWSPSLHKEEPEDLLSESPVGQQAQFTEHPDSHPTQDETSKSNQKILADTENGNLGQSHDPNPPIRTLTVKRPYKCPICLDSFSSEKMAEQHVQTHSEDKSSVLRCQFCNQCFTHKSDLVVHTRIHTDVQLARPISVKVPPEQQCEQKWRPNQGQENPSHPQAKKDQELKSSHVDQQLKGAGQDGTEQEPQAPSHLDQSPLTNLPYGFKSEPIVLEDHWTAENNTDSQFVRTAGLDSPEEDVDGFPTPVVSELSPFTDRRVLAMRIAGKACEFPVQFEVGTGQKPYECPHCVKCFSSTKTLARHVRIHTETKLHQCQFCQRNFCQKSDLVIHVRSHTGEKPYQCLECHRCFSHKSNLTVHMRTHTRNAPWPCLECGVRFGRQEDLAHHTMMHRGIAP